MNHIALILAEEGLLKKTSSYLPSEESVMNVLQGLGDGKTLPDISYNTSTGQVKAIFSIESGTMHINGKVDSDGWFKYDVELHLSNQNLEAHIPDGDPYAQPWINSKLMMKDIEKKFKIKT